MDLVRFESICEDYFVLWNNPCGENGEIGSRCFVIDNCTFVLQWVVMIQWTCTFDYLKGKTINTGPNFCVAFWGGTF